MKDKNVDRNPDCPCTYRDCERNRNCKACREYHHSQGQKTTCEREKEKAGK